jgi:hypothetical protein
MATSAKPIRPPQVDAESAVRYLRSLFEAIGQLATDHPYYELIVSDLACIGEAIAQDVLRDLKDIASAA